MTNPGPSVAMVGTNAGARDGGGGGDEDPGIGPEDVAGTAASVGVGAVALWLGTSSAKSIRLCSGA